ncbi:endonuclease domain-containing protein [Azospirillum rugosum]|uniref:Very-short-patch-repair endonuclease n=1 Tax=Azospirillum rugosum TaxID=416170 RepID=A0ABS4SID4_9PROT|nr:endonuclease domain-containing protein [Azospirillum rugosum]MBP2292320.1 very-short-patch-repair endonuclease [Azospirillum rugosum]MDQ0526079.1 very-short-patch-repair endonuclease [Azospirillum rugosum]
MTSQRARSLRQSATDAEKLLWGAVRDRRLAGLKFRRQQRMGRYVVDFICHDRRLIVELDGSQHTVVADAERTAFLESQGYQVMRIWNPDVFRNLTGVLETILAVAEGRLFDGPL